MLATLAPLQPKDPNGELFVVAIGRISTVGQDHENIEASFRFIKEYLDRIYDGPLQIKFLGEQASGMLTDRASIREAEDLVATGKVDIVISEDLSRIYRNPRHQYDFVQNAVDMETRVICVGDNLDTSDENWEVTMGAAALRHGLHIPDTRRRVRRTATHSFHGGGMVLKIRFGYRKLTKNEAASGEFGPKDLRIAKVPGSTPVIRKMMDRVMRGQKYRAIAEWLQDEGIKPGSYVENGQWTARLVTDLLDDPILSGTRTFRDTICRPIFRTGKHKSTKNPEPETEFCPELAHLGVEEHKALRSQIARRRAQYVSKEGRNHNRYNIPRSRSIWPGQAVTCAICGGLMYYFGKHLKCKNSFSKPPRSCWNHVQILAELTRKRVLDWLLGHLDGVPGGREILVDAVWKILEPAQRRCLRSQDDLDHEIGSLEKKGANMAEAIAEGGQLKVLVAKLKEVEKALKKARARKAAERKKPKDDDTCPSREKLRQNLDETLREMINTSCEFADLMKKLFPQFAIQPIQALDSGLVRPRANLTFRLSTLVDAEKTGQGESTCIDDVQVVLDLFEPPSPILHLPRCLAAKRDNPKLSLKKLAALLGINHMTVKRSFDYARLMEAQNMTEPYRELHSCPEKASRWRRLRKAP